MKEMQIPTNKGMKVVLPQNIIRVEAYSNYSKVFFDNEYPLTVAKVLQWFEDKLPEDFFCRIHRTHLVNRQFISSVSGDFKLTLYNGEQFKVSRRKKSVFRQMVA
jgi:two-component system, LytTR family, response regulator